MSVRIDNTNGDAAVSFQDLEAFADERRRTQRQPMRTQSQSSVSIDELARSVHLLSEAVQEQQKGRADEETIRRIVDEMTGQLRAQRRNGPTPGDTEALTGVSFDRQEQELRLMQGNDRLDAIVCGAPQVVATVTRRSEDQVRQFQQAASRMAILTSYLRQQSHDPHEFNPRATQYYRHVFQPAMQAMDTDTTAEGVEYVPRLLGGVLIDRISLQLVVASLFDSIDMPSNPFDVPALSATRLMTGKAIQNDTDTGQVGFKKLTAGTRKVTLTAAKLAGEILISRELEEDAIIAMLPTIEAELVDYLAADIENATINGDVSGTHMDSDVTDPVDVRKLWVGLRKSVPTAAKTDISNAAPTVANALRANRKKMKKYGTRPDQLAHIIGLGAYVAILADTSVLTLEKYGPHATVLTGELGRVDGSPVIVSEFMREDLNVSGVYDGTTTTRTHMLTVNTKAFLYGQRRDVSIQVLRELYAEYDQDAVIASLRRAFSPKFPSTEPAIAQAYNIAN